VATRAAAVEATSCLAPEMHWNLHVYEAGSAYAFFASGGKKV